MPIELRHQAATDIGLRPNNEDAFVADDELGFYAVADGMGGYDGGEIASWLAIDGLTNFFRRATGPLMRRMPGGRTVAEQMMDMALRQVSGEIVRRRTGRLRSMGTTIAAALIREGHVLLVHVGDSRIYRLRRGELRQLTTDHTLGAQMLQTGSSSAEAASRSNVLTRAVGVPGACRPDMRIEVVRPGDRFLLCSDGLSDVLPEEELELALAKRRPAADRMVELAVDAEGADNITAVVVHAVGTRTSTPG